MLPLPSTSGREITKALSWSRRARFLLIPAGVLVFIFLLQSIQPPTSNHGFAKYVRQQRYASYSPSATEYQIAVISDMDVKSRISEKEMKWQGVLKIGQLKREDGKYSVEWTADVRTSHAVAVNISFQIWSLRLKMFFRCGVGCCVCLLCCRNNCPQSTMKRGEAWSCLS